MQEKISLGQIGRIRITAGRSVSVGALALAIVYTLIGRKFFRLRPITALMGGMSATGLHFFSELWHQMGHARTAENTGYPMEGIHLWGILGTSIYPDDEPLVTPEIHIRRAMGGPKASAFLTVLGGLLTVVTRPLGGLIHMLAAVFTLENLLIFTIGAFLPLNKPETDGTVLRRYRRQQRPRRLIIQE